MEAWSRIVERIERLLPMLEDLLRGLTGAVPESGFFDSARAFRWDVSRGPGRVVAISKPAHFDIEDLLGVEEPVEKFIQNTEQFLTGLPFNHVLLYGERGTGKSSAVRGLLARYEARGLRLVEVKREDLVQLPSVLAALRAGREHHFLLFCDDLSFGSDERGFRELKAALEGSLEEPPPNVCLVATSNRRHLLPESMDENREARVDKGGELHVGESLNEKLALSDRFGLVLGFHGFDQETYLAIVSRYVAQAGVEFGVDAVREEALAWALRRGSRSGRIARQFVDDCVGRHRLSQRKARGEADQPPGPGGATGAGA